MRLFLSSYRAGNHQERLVELFVKGAEVAVITNAKDYKTPQERQVSVAEVMDFFSKLSMNPTEIDLREYFNKTDNLQEKISQYQAVWLAGGNTFLLRRALRQSGLEPILGDIVRKNEIVLGGESAGAIIMGPTLKYAEMEGDEDNPRYVPEGYSKEIIWEGLDFIAYVPVPHYQHLVYGPEINKDIQDLQQQKIPYKTMTEEQAILINNDKEEFLE